MSEQGPKRGDERFKPTAAMLVIVQVANAFSKVADRVGIPFSVFLLLLGAVYGMGNEKTRDDFIRELLFGELNSSPALRIFFGALVAIIIVGSIVLREKTILGEADEVKRIAVEKVKLQERLLGATLHHGVPGTTTGDPPGEAPGSEER